MRIIQFGFVILGFVAVSRCTTVSEISDLGLRAPNASRAQSSEASKQTDHATTVLNRYRESQQMAMSGKTDEACTGFLAIFQDDSIPEAVRLLAQVRGAATCPPEKASLPTNPPKWLAEETAKAKIALAEHAHDPILMAEALREIAGFEKTQKLRLDRATKALEILSSLPPGLRQTPAAQDAVLQTQAKLVEIAPRYHLQYPKAATNAPTPMALAQDLRSARKFDEARKLYQSIARDRKQSATERLKALDGYRMTFKLQLRTTEFLQATRAWLAFANKQFLQPGLKRRDTNLVRTYVDTGVSYARAIWTDHRPSDALKYLEDMEAKIAKTFPAFSLHESVLVRARIAEERGEFQKMHDILAKLDIEKLPDRATKAKILWFRGWNLRRLPGRQEMALAILEQANKYEDSHGSLTRNMYWMARLNRDLGRKDIADKIFSELGEFSHFGYYGILAHYELGKRFDPLPEANVSYDPRSRSPIPDDLRVPTDWFIALQELEVGRRFLEAYPTREVWNSTFSIERKEAMLGLMARLELYIQATIRMEELSPEDRVRILRRSPGLLFPLPYESRIREEASKQGLDPALIYSIIRQESLFNPFARSHADAFGLMQLIPEVAAVAAGRLGLKLSSPDDLYDPEFNIPLGTVFLRDLFQKYDGRFILAVSAYNANDRAIQGWLRTRMRPDPLEFIEEIPYEETRTYVKLVLRNFVTYQRRLNSQAVAFPDWTLRLQPVSN